MAAVLISTSNKIQFSPCSLENWYVILVLQKLWARLHCLLSKNMSKVAWRKTEINKISQWVRSLWAIGHASMYVIHRYNQGYNVLYYICYVITPHHWLITSVYIYLLYVFWLLILPPLLLHTSLYYATQAFTIEASISVYSKAVILVKITTYMVK